MYRNGRQISRKSILRKAEKWQAQQDRPRASSSALAPHILSLMSTDEKGRICEKREVWFHLSELGCRKARREAERIEPQSRLQTQCHSRRSAIATPSLLANIFCAAASNSSSSTSQMDAGSSSRARIARVQTICPNLSWGNSRRNSSRVCTRVRSSTLTATCPRHRVGARPASENLRSLPLAPLYQVPIEQCEWLL